MIGGGGSSPELMARRTSSPLRRPSSTALIFGSDQE